METIIAATLADPQVLALRERLTHRDAALDDQFALYLVDWFQRRAVLELDGPLDDSIPSGA